MQLCNDSVQTGSSIRPWELVTPLLMKETTDLGKLIPLISAGTHTDTVYIHVLGCCMFPCENRQLLLSNVMNINKHFFLNPSHTLIILKNSFFLHYTEISLLPYFSFSCLLSHSYLALYFSVCTQKHIYM